MSSKPRINEYMSDSVETICSTATIDELIRRMEQADHDGFPVCSGRQLVGYVEAKDVISDLYSDEINVSDIMKTDYPVFSEDMGVQTAGRIMFREGKSEVPVIDKNNNLIGLLTNTDIIRSQIERTTPRKVESLNSMLSQIHGDISIEEYEEDVRISDVIPTQDKVYRDELKGRKYELQNGLAEPIVIVKCSGKKLVADGHHRVVSAGMIDMDTINAYVLHVQDDIEIGLIKQARSQNLRTIHDIEVVENEEHPHIKKMNLISDL